MKLLLRREGKIFKTTAEFEIIKAIKEVCKVIDYKKIVPEREVSILLFILFIYCC